MSIQAKDQHCQHQVNKISFIGHHDPLQTSHQPLDIRNEKIISRIMIFTVGYYKILTFLLIFLTHPYFNVHFVHAL